METSTDIANKFNLDQLDELADGLGTRILKSLNLSGSPQMHISLMSGFEDELKNYNLSTSDIIINKGFAEGKLLSEQYEFARTNLSQYLMVQSRFG